MHRLLFPRFEMNLIVLKERRKDKDVFQTTFTYGMDVKDPNNLFFEVGLSNETSSDSSRR